METRVRFIAVGLFVIFLGAASVAAFLWLTRGIERVTYDRYRAFFRESVSGLGPDAPVKYRGVQVGRVKEIVLNPKNVEEVRLTLDIARGTPVKTDTVATLKVQGLTGLAFLDLSGGSQGSPILRAKAGETYPVIPTAPSLLARLDTDVTKLITGASGFAEDARALIDEENRAELKQILHDLAELTRTLARRSEIVDRGVQDGAKALENIARITGTLDAQAPVLLGNLNRGTAALEGTAGEVSEAGREVARAGRELASMVKENRQNIERFTRQGLPEYGALAAELRQLAVQLQRLERQLEREPNSVVLGRYPEPPGPGE